MGRESIMNMAIPQTLPGQRDSAEYVDIGTALRTFWRRKALFLATFLLVSSLVILMTSQQQPLYNGTASVMVDLKKSNAADLQAVVSGLPPDSALVDTEVEILRSRALADKVVTKLNLVNDAEFNAALQKPSSLQKFKRWAVSLVPSPLSDTPEAILSDADVKDQIADSVLSKLAVYRKGTTYVININFESTDPDKAAIIANTFSETYLFEQLDAKFEATSRANNWLTERLDSLRQEVRSAEQAVEYYRGQSGLLSARGSSLTEQQISDLNAQLIIQTAEYNEIAARLVSVKRQISQGSAADTIGEVLASSVIRDLRRQQSEVAQRRADLSSRYGPRHPDVLKVERETADIQVQIDQEIQRIVSNLESEVGISRQRVASIETGLQRLRGELTSNNRSLVRLRELERDAEASRTLYESFLEKFKQNDDQESITQPDARVISKAVVPTSPTSPNLMVNAVLGIFLGLLAGLGFVVLAEMLDNGLATGADVEREIGLPFIAAVPKVSEGWFGWLKALFRRPWIPETYIQKFPLSMYVESLRTIRSKILLSDANQTAKVVAITSALPGEGKTTLAQSLGHLSAMSGSRTIIVDCDLRLQQLSKVLDSATPHGLVKYLKGDTAMRSIITTDKKTGCDLILNSPNEYSNRDLFGTPQFTKLLSALRRKYDLIILDTSPVLLVAETRTIVNLSDSVVLVARWRRTKSDAVKTAKNILEDVRANVAGVVLSRVNMKARRKYGAGDYSYYSRQYGSYYTHTEDGT